jgi:hypothetical protein
MPDLGQLLGLVQWERVLGLAVVPLALQFIAALIHPAVFKAVSLLTILGIIAIGILDGMGAADLTAYHAQVVEMVSVTFVVLVGHLLIRSLFRAMARASHAA